MNSKFKKIMGICLSMTLVFSLTLPVYAELSDEYESVYEESEYEPDYEFDETTGHLTIWENINDIDSIPKDKIKTVSINYGVTEIGERAFKGCTCLESVKIPASVTKIGQGAFLGCTSLKEVKIPDCIEIGENVFESSTKLIKIPAEDKHLTLTIDVGLISADLFLSTHLEKK